MRQRSASILLLLFLASLVPEVASLSQPTPITTRGGNKQPGSINMPPSSSSTALRGGASADTDTELKSYSSEAAGLFGNLRVPAALFSGASAGAAFAMPLAAGGAEGLKVGLVKRLYALLMISSLASQITVVVVSTLAMGALSLQKGVKTKSLKDLLELEYDLEWTAVRFNFLAGLFCFSVASGMRAWVSIACPVFGKASLGIILSTTLLCVAFVRDIFRYGSDAFLFNLPFKFAKLVFERAKKDSLFGLAMMAYLITGIYMVTNVPHVLNWLAAGN